ncbi:hypothetical protein OW492_02780 [Psychromonas sp. 14N.309.X.WAT.B.A12]|uniref:hypothetical protein n=1 Tax=Psychromonas sp. 14N.309.X.WAT.B.A12 TaxID=2998322 RepID=UPI0025AF747D|nr:hypothetical protein [Psychromonas sp. 14N.309.X.WAT.B.A12]MDN2662303.1 hypothetical protein [Psychromonas sp. 14N.309.X.WAT.B.A12]
MKFITILALFLSGITQSLAQEIIEHSHLPITVPVDIPSPRLSLKLSKDTIDGYNLTLNTKHYSLIPPPKKATMAELMKVSIDPRSNVVEGHAHLYINGTKIRRIYGKTIHIPLHYFKNGINTVSVTLNNHGHMYWVAENKKILATLYIDTNSSPFITYRFESFPIL